jgi:protease II
VNICYHGSDVSGRVWLLVGGVWAKQSQHTLISAKRGPTLDALKVLQHWLVEEERVSLVERVDLASRRDADIGMGQDELSDALRLNNISYAIQTSSQADSRYPVCTHSLRALC